MLRRIISTLLVSTLLLVGCSEANPTEELENAQNKTEQETNRTLNDTAVKPPTTNKSTTLILNNEDISYTNFLQTDTFLYFVDTNNKLSVIEEPIDTPYILEEQVSETLNYSVGNITSINNEIFFTDIADGDSLYKLNYEKKEATKISSGSFFNISSYKNNIIFINKNKGWNLSYLDMKTLKIVPITSDRCGKYLINGDNIIYQNLSDNSYLYSIRIDGSQKTKLTSLPVDSFVSYKNSILNLSGENNSLYIYDPITKTNKNITNINGANLKSYDGNLFYIGLSNSNHLFELTIDDTLESSTSTKLVSDMINDYFPTKNGIFLKKPVDINKIFFIEYE